MRVPSWRSWAALVTVVAATVPALAQPITAGRATAGAARCTLGAPEALGASSSPGIAVQVSFTSPGHGLVAWSADADHLATRAIDGATLSATRTEPFAHAIDLSLLASVRNREQYLALTATALCDSLGQACWQARGLRADGRASGPALEEPPGGQNPMVEDWQPAADGVWVAQNSRWGPARVARYTLGADGRVTVRALGTVQTEAGGAGFAALAAAGSGVWALGQAEDHPRDLLVLPDGGRHPVRGLPPLIRVESLTVEGSSAWLFFRVGSGRPRVARLGADGTLIDRARPVTDSDVLPAALADLVRPAIQVRGSRIVLMRKDAAGRSIGLPTEISNARATRVETAVAWSGSDFAVAYALRGREGWNVWLRRASCR